MSSGNGGPTIFEPPPDDLPKFFGAYMMSMADSKITTLIAALPREVRNNIYSYLWGQDSVRTIGSVYGGRMASPELRSDLLVRFPWRVLSPRQQEEAIQWAYENLDSGWWYLDGTDVNCGLDSQYINRYLSRGVFNTSFRPIDFHLTRLSVTVSLETEHGLSRDDLAQDFSGLYHAKLKKGFHSVITLTQDTDNPIKMRQIHPVLRQLKLPVTDL
jgi:hypothetical protein